MSVNTLGGKVTHQMANGVILEDVSTYLRDYDVQVPDTILDIWANFYFPKGIARGAQEMPST